MTLILTEASPRHVLQVADRLATRDTGEAFDTLANKNVVYLCRDAILTLGYTGIAYLENMPTDVWIAERLTGLQLRTSGFISLGCPAQYYFHKAIEKLVRDLAGPLSHQPLSFEIAIAGWNWRRASRKQRPTTPIAMTIKYTPSAGLKVNRPTSRHWQYRGMAFRASPPQNLSRHLHDSIQSELLRLPNHDTAEKVLFDAIRATADVNPRVGGDCMSILLAPPHLACYGRVKYLPRPAPSKGANPLPQLSPKVFSPWVITPGSVTSPAEMICGATVSWNHWRIDIEAPPSNVIVWRSQTRPKLR